MKSQLYSLSHGPLRWVDKWPPKFKSIGLPGSTKASASGAFGDICVQEFALNDWYIHFNVFNLFEKFIARQELLDPGIFSSQQLKGNAVHRFNEQTLYSIGRNQVLLSHAISQGITTQFNPGLHISFDVFIRDEVARDIIQLLQEPGISLPGWTKISWTNMESLDIIQSILRCPHPASLYAHYFESRIKDLLLNYLLSTSLQKPLYPCPSKKEEESITNIREFIDEHLREHWPITALARKAGMNEQRFKQLFKHMVAMGPYEYLLRKRMRKARQMLLAGKSAKEVSRHFGYRPSNFTALFKNFFGYGPSDVPK
jgi:AraC-like DNA-binding protein